MVKKSIVIATLAAQVVDGEFWLALDGQPEKTYTAGQSLELPMKAIHNEGSLGCKRRLEAIEFSVFEATEDVAFCG